MHILQSTSLFTVTTFFAFNVEAGFWRMNCGRMLTGRIVPVVSPGAVSSHVPNLVGGYNIGLNSSFNDMVASKCTSCEIAVDKCAYWTPQLYYEHGNGTFQDVPNGGTIVYYLGRGDDLANVKPFPPGFKVLSGNALARSYDNVTKTWNGARNIADRVSFVCLNTTGGYPEEPGMDHADCSYALRAQIQMQSCWDGVNLFKSDNSHVAYLSEIDNGVCPPSHPILFMQLFYEMYYEVAAIQRSGGRFVFANGDPTGYEFHGDFLYGWDSSVLTSALAQCAQGTAGSGLISDCHFDTRDIDNDAAISQTKSLLLGLPHELRDKIYRNLLVAENTVREEKAEVADESRSIAMAFEAQENINNNTHEIDKADLIDMPSCDFDGTLANSLLDTGILRVNKQLYAEGLKILHDENTFRISPHLTKRQKTLKRVRRLHIHAGMTRGVTVLHDLEEIAKILTTHNGGLKNVKVVIRVPDYNWAGRFEGSKTWKVALVPLCRIRVKERVQFLVEYDNIFDSNDGHSEPQTGEQKTIAGFLKSLEKTMVGEPDDTGVVWPVEIGVGPPNDQS